MWNVDPFANREAKRYENPIPSREFIILYLSKKKAPVSHSALCKEFELSDDASRCDALDRRLHAMVRKGQIEKVGQTRFKLPNRLNLVTGQVHAHKEGTGHVIPQESSDYQSRIFLTALEMSRVFHGDVVTVMISDHHDRYRRQGTIVDCLERNTQQVVGRLSKTYEVLPDHPKLRHHRVQIHKQDRHKAKPGQFVVAKITQQPEVDQSPQGVIIEILGEHFKPGMETQVALRYFDLPHEFSRAVYHEAKQLNYEISEQDINSRIDIRQLPLVTIDGEYAKDFDDAVYAEPRKGGGYRLIVAIADVSHYVKPDTALDIEAYNRGNSVYLPQQVVPMLPEALSNELCALKPDVERLCMVCDVTVGAKGRITGYDFYEAVMHSKARLTYEQVTAVLENELELPSELMAPLAHLHGLYQILREAREKRGSIDVDTTENRILFSDQQKIEKILPEKRTVSHRIIEECMLLANQCSAQFFEENQLLGLYRVHQSPSEDGVANLAGFLHSLDIVWKTKTKKVTPNDYQQLMEQTRDRPEAHLIQTVMLRSMEAARYQVDNQGHFGLALKKYTHFTSPIRRYPDLLVHRAIRYMIRGRKASQHVIRVRGADKLLKQNIYPYDELALGQACEHCSMTERRADEATRYVVNWLKCQYVQDHVGDHFEGVITSVVGFGLFIELSDIYVEGLVHISTLDDYFSFDPQKHSLTGRRTGRSYRIGDPVRVRVNAVNLDTKEIHLELIEAVAKPKKKAKKKHKKKDR